MSDGKTEPLELTILSRLGLAHVAIVDHLVLIVKRFRPAQQRDLLATLDKRPQSVATHVEAYFDRKLDVKDELERYLQDLMKILNLVRHQQIEEELASEMLTLFTALGEGADRLLLTKIFQILGVRGLKMLCRLCLQLPIKLQGEFYLVFADEGAVMELKMWMLWLDKVHGQHHEEADGLLQCLIKCCFEQCVAHWLKLLRPLSSSSRISVLQKLDTIKSYMLKPLARFHDITGLAVTKILELCEGFLLELQFFLSEIPMATTMTVIVKLNSDRSIANLRLALECFAKTDVIQLVDAMAIHDNPRAIELFLAVVVQHPQKHDLLYLFLRLTGQNQVRFLELIFLASKSEDTVILREGIPRALVVIQLFLSAKVQSYDGLIQKFTSLPEDAFENLVSTTSKYSREDISLLVEAVDAIDSACVRILSRLFDLFIPSLRPTLVAWLHEIPGTAGMPVYDLFFHFQDQKKLTAVIQMLFGLQRADKLALCTLVLHPVPMDGSATGSTDDGVNEKIVLYLCECSLSRHKVIKLLSAITKDAYEGLLFLLRTQRMPEQVALTKLMLSLSTISNACLLNKLQSLEAKILDEFFQLLLVIPKVEYKMLARLLVSKQVTNRQFQDFVHVVANLMNQAASRETVIFTAELPARYRNMFFSMISDKPERGILLRIVACSSRLPPDLLYLLIELLVRVTWEIRSALIEQIQAIEEIRHIEDFFYVLRDFDEDSYLPRLVHVLNSLPIPDRITLATLLGPLSVPERKRTIIQLDTMSKDRMPACCRVVCDPSCGVGTEFLRVLGQLDGAYHLEMVRLLQFKICWGFVQILSRAVSSSISDDTNPCSAVVNGFATVATLLETESDFALLQCVMSDALGHALQLEEFVLVLAHFRTRAKLLKFLNHSAKLASFAQQASALYFRVLSRCRPTLFLFDMCRLLDMDDALYALRRLERLCNRDADALDAHLFRMARRPASQAKDEFCHFVLGYQERGIRAANESGGQINRVVIPTASQSTVDKDSISTGFLWEMQTEDPMTTTREVPSERRVLVDRHARLLESKDSQPRRSRNWRDWSVSDWEDVLDQGDVIDGRSNIRDQAASPENRCYDLPRQGLGQSISLATEANVIASGDVDPRSNITIENKHLTLPPLSRAEGIQCIPRSNHVSSSESKSSTRSKTIATSPQLIRSESAPTTLCMDPYVIANPEKLSRGLSAALEEAPSFHVARDRGASIFHHQCVYEQEHGPSRLRVAKTDAAQAKVLATRVQRALGRRSVDNIIPIASPLLRSDVHTIAQAHEALQLAAASRASQTLRFPGSI